MIKTCCYDFCQFCDKHYACYFHFYFIYVQQKHQHLMVNINQALHIPLPGPTLKYLFVRCPCVLQPYPNKSNTAISLCQGPICVVTLFTSIQQSNISLLDAHVCSGPQKHIIIMWSIGLDVIKRIIVMCTHP